MHFYYFSLFIAVNGEKEKEKTQLPKKNVTNSNTNTIQEKLEIPIWREILLNHIDA